MQKIAYLIQADNGVYTAEIRDEYGQVESAIVAHTAHEVHEWAFQHDCDNIELED